MEDDLAHLRALLEQGKVEPARTFVKEMERRWPESTAVQHYVRVLAPPVVRVVPGNRARPRDREFAWIREHAREHPGCWMAVLEDKLIAADPRFAVVLKRVRETPGAEDALFHYQYAPSKPVDTEV